jgi:ADP-ribose pyrophosphatase YjhB (NUDIX family)
MEEIRRFNVRVYGCLTHPDLGILTSVEKIQGRTYRKFPGGGLEWGESTRDCLQREFLEELDLPVQAGAHIYTTDFFQRSAFRPNEQVISIYMEAIPDDGTKERLQDLQALEKDHRAEWISLHNFHEDLFELPTDRAFAQLMKQQP